MARQAWLESARAYLAACVSQSAAATIFGDAGEVEAFCWASVHEGSSSHVPHTHPQCSVSGVFYVAVPPGAGEITFDDPRAAHAPTFAGSHRKHLPTAGELLLFPPYVIHSVGESAAAPTPRVSISFNLYSSMAGADEGDVRQDEPYVDDEGNEEWALLSDTEVIVEPE